ncbi:hypothetical protein ATY27_03405 [Rheinheimera sp. F8]|nr:hypothetical protein ATY27_03405 [Rheinheimera sp. F8]
MQHDQLAMPPLTVADDQPTGHWVGGAAMWPGVGLFIGRAGDNQEHHHWAHQLVIGLDGEVELSVGPLSRRAPALFVPAGASHRLTPAEVLMVFLDPTTAMSRALCQRVIGAAAADCSDDANPIRILPADLAELFRVCLVGTVDLATAAEQIRAGLIPNCKGPDERINKVLTAIMPGTDLSQRLNRRQLADLAGLSETRFSHWFKEATGMPLRSYRKWLNLVHGLEHALRGQNLTTAAHQAEFADQAHFSRTFTQMFGVNARDVIAQVRLLPTTTQHQPSTPGELRALSGMSFFDGRS